uniref:RNA polymerase Rpb4/RPC9 core domain-containing protein n=1 Tax=Alexandrium catenella TaxID=2925 RepID=A0A7S1LR33_ALECA
MAQAPPGPKRGASKLPSRAPRGSGPQTGAAMATVNPRDVDSARVGKDGKIMLGESNKHPCFHISEVDVLLGQILTKRARDTKPVSEELQKTMQYCKRFKPLKNDPAALKAKDQLLRRVDCRDQDGNARKLKRLRDFEAAQLLTLMPATEDEAKALIPTLEGNVFLSSLIAEVQPMRDFDRAIQ